MLFTRYTIPLKITRVVVGTGVPVLARVTCGMLHNLGAFPIMRITCGEEAIVRIGILALDNNSLNAFPGYALVCDATFATIITGLPICNRHEYATLNFVACVHGAIVGVTANNRLCANANAVVIAMVALRAHTAVIAGIPRLRSEFARAVSQAFSL